MKISAVPLTAAAFTPFGQVIERPVDFGRVYFSDALANGRAVAKASLTLSKARPLEAAALTAAKMEGHEFSSQSFVPIDVSRYLVIVAPHAAGGGPDGARLHAFVARGYQGVTYGMNIWHHPLCVLDRPGQFAVFMWLDGGRGDEEIVDLPAPVLVSFPTPARS